MKPRVLLIQPPIYDFAAFDLFVKPYSLLRLGAWLESGGYDVALVDALDPYDESTRRALGPPSRRPDGTGKFFRQIVEKPAAVRDVPRHFCRYGVLRPVLEARIREACPDIVLIASGMTYWYPGVREAVECVRRAAPRAPVVVGGTYATLCRTHAEQSLGADRIIAGPALPALAAVLEEYDLPVPAGPLPRTQALLPRGFRDAAAVRLHTGCPLHCAYCASHLVSGAFDPGRGEDLFEEVLRIHRRFGVTDFAFYDDALLAQAETGIIPFLERVIDSGLSLRFHAPNGLHVAFLTERIARLMQRAGVINFKLGYESSAPEFHAALDGKHNAALFDRAMDALRSGGYRPEEAAVYVLAGLPEQRPAEVEESIHTAARAGVQVFVAEYSPIPGTPLWQKSVALSRYPLETEPLTHNNSIFPLQGADFTREHLQELKTLAGRLRRSLAAG